MVATIRTTIDTGGRVVIPKAMRDELGLRPGRRVDVVIDGFGVMITPVPIEVELVRKGNVLVAVHKTDEPFTWTREQERELLEATRDRRR